jgi:hypothetical protein
MLGPTLYNHGTPYRVSIVPGSNREIGFVMGHQHGFHAFTGVIGNSEPLRDFAGKILTFQGWHTAEHALVLHHRSAS